MADDTKYALLSNLLDRVPALLIVLGVVACLIGLAGGVTYHSWFEIKDLIPRVGACVLGVALLILGMIQSRAEKHGRIRASDYGIKIVHPAAGEHVGAVDVKGTISRPLPDGYLLRVFRLYPGSNNFVPLAKARFTNDGKSWVAENCSPGGKAGDRRALAAYIVGSDAEALIDFHNEAVAVHRKTMDELKKATGVDADFLPSVARRTQDMYECDRVQIVRA